jgi:hypothetical protein
MKKVYCADCLLEYGSPGWIDAVVSDDVWNTITPDGVNILCIHCMNRRCADRDLDQVPVALQSGRFVAGQVVGVLPLLVKPLQKEDTSF